MSSYSPPTEFTPIFNSYAFQESDDAEHTHTTDDIQNVVSVNALSDASPYVGNVGQNTRTNLCQVSWDWDETNASYFYTYIKVDYNNLAVAINGTYMTGFANFSDSGTLIVNPSTLANNAIDYTLNTGAGDANNGISIIGRAEIYAGNVNFNAWNGSLWFEYINGEKKITIYNYNQNNTFVPASGGNFQYNQQVSFYADLLSSGLNVGQVGAATLYPL